MKAAAVFTAACVASATAFAPATGPQSSSTRLHASFFDKVANMDLWAPISDSNDYGARGKKQTGPAALSSRSYVPAGLTKAQYEKIRADEDKKKKANYDRNVKKAFKFQDYTAFYTKRGSDENGSWMNLPNRGHDMAKTKYDWSGETNQAPAYTGVGEIFKVGGKGKK